MGNEGGAVCCSMSSSGADSTETAMPIFADCCKILLVRVI